MSKFLSHEPCPKCGSKDNLSVWDDGHRWCFGCGHYIPADNGSFSILKSKIKQTETFVPTCALPKDSTFLLPKMAEDWLAKYNVYSPLIIKYRIQWSPKSNSLILPVYDEQRRLIFYQLRRFGENVTHKDRYLSYGVLTSFIPVLGADAINKIHPSTVVIVEDFVSAMRVGEWLPTVPLFGSHIDPLLAKRLGKLYHNLIIWLDSDKYKEAVNYSAKYSVFFDTTKVISTQMDPKGFPSFSIASQLRARTSELVD